MADDKTPGGAIVKLKISRIDAKKKEKLTSKNKKTGAEETIEIEVPDYEATSTDSMDAQFNPETFKLDISAETSNSTNAANTNIDTATTNSTDAKAVTKLNDLTFTLIFDSSYNGAPDIAPKIEFLNKLFYGKDGTRATPAVIITYGEFIKFQGTPSKLSLSYVLFSSDGYPVRAIAELTITGNNRLEKLKGKTWDKMELEDVAGSSDTLPGYAKKKLGDAALYTTVAAANKLPNLMKLAPGVKLKTPGIL